MIVLWRYLIMGQTEWIEHRRQDGELIGWVRPEGEEFVPVDRLGRDLFAYRLAPTLNRLSPRWGISFLAGPFELQLEDGTWEQVPSARSFPHCDSTQERGFRGDWRSPGGVHRAFPAPETLRAAFAGSGQ
jgi:hypothetical protein